MSDSNDLWFIRKLIPSVIKRALDRENRCRDSIVMARSLEVVKRVISFFGFDKLAWRHWFKMFFHINFHHFSDYFEVEMKVHVEFTFLSKPGTFRSKIYSLYLFGMAKVQLLVNLLFHRINKIS